MLPALAFVAVAATAQDYRDYLCKEIKQPFFSSTAASGGPDAGRGGRTVRLARRLAHPITFEMPKPAKAKRILVVGESVAAKLYDAGRDALTAAAENAWPGWKVEHINAGMTAYNSRRIEAVLEEGLAYDPDLVVVLSGNNEHDALEMCPSVWEGLERQFKRTALYRALAAHRRAPEGYARELSMRRHEWQLRRMAQAAKARGVPLVFATLPANERDMPPAGEAPLDDPGFARGAAALEAGRPAQAAGLFEARSKGFPEDAMARWFRARALEKSGDAAAALAEFQDAVRLDPKGDRSSTERNAMIRRVAKEEGAAVADLEEAFHEAAGGRPLGADLLADPVHWYPRLNPFVAVRLLAAAGRPWPAGVPRAGLPVPAVPTPAARREELQKVLLYGLREASYWAGTDRRGTLAERPIAAFGRVDEEARPWLLELSVSTAAMRPKLIENYWVQDLAEDQETWWPVYLAHLGEMFRRKGEPALALPLFDRASAASPRRTRTRLWRALALKALGRKKEAAAALKELGSAQDPVVESAARAY